MIHLKRPQAGMRVAVGEGIESCAEHDVLPYALSDGARKFVLRIAAARRHESAKCARKGMALFGIGSEFVLGFGADNPQCQRIVKNCGLIKKLVSGATNRDPLCCPAEWSLLHQRAHRPADCAVAAVESPRGQSSCRSPHAESPTAG